MNILIVKLSSLGDVVHTLPAVQDILRAHPGAQVDWVVESGFAPLVGRCQGVRRVIACDLRAWRRRWWQAATRVAWRAFKAQLQAEAYDAVIDCQGLTKSALVARLARLAPQGKRYALANRTDGSSYERPTRWLADVAVGVAAHTGAVQRSRLLCAQALGYTIVQNDMRFGLLAGLSIEKLAIKNIAFEPAPHTIALIHGSSREDKCWAVDHWIDLAQRLAGTGMHVALLHGNALEEARSRAIADALEQRIGPGVATVWPRLPLDQLACALARCSGAIGVDSGLSHIAVALLLPHVQIYNFDTAWRTGPHGNPQQCSVFAAGQPTLEAVWAAWCRVSLAAGLVKAPWVAVEPLSADVTLLVPARAAS